MALALGAGSGQIKPSVGIYVIPRHSLTIAIHKPKAVLGVSKSLLSGLLESLHRFRKTLRHSPTLVIHDPEFVLCEGLEAFASKHFFRQEPDFLVRILLCFYSTPHKFFGPSWKNIHFKSLIFNTLQNLFKYFI